MLENILTFEIKEVMRENALNLVEIMILEGIPFRTVLWNNNNWNEKLPEKIMASFPTQIVLDIKDAALQESYIDEATGEVIISTVFDGVEYSKVVEYDEIIAVLDLEGQPYMINNFIQEERVEPVTEFEKALHYVPKTVEDLVEMAVSEGISEDNAKRSINSFMKNNEHLRERFGVK